MDWVCSKLSIMCCSYCCVKRILIRALQTMVIDLNIIR